MDLTSPRTIKSIQEKFGFTFKKGLGQNFLTSRDVLMTITDAVSESDGIIEIGPGFGTLTSELAKTDKRVVSIELDDRLTEVLSYTLAGYENVKLIHADALKTDFHKIINEEFEGGSVSVAANLPYYITTPIITKLLEDKLPLDNIVVMVQREVARRLCAAEGTKDYGAITLLCRYHCETEIIADVKASLFVPPPKVDSAVVRLQLLGSPAVKTLDEKNFFRTVKAAFSQRRKTLLNCICANFQLPKDKAAGIISGAGVDPSRRGETLSIDEFAAVADAIYNYITD